MANLSVTEYAQVGHDLLGSPLPCGLEPVLAIQNVTFTTTTASSAFNAETNFVRVIADADARIKFGTAPTATSTDILIAQGSAEYFAVPKGQSYKVAAITA